MSRLAMAAGIAWGLPLAPTAAQSPNEISTGNRLLEAAARAVYEQPRLEAKIRQRAMLFGQQLTGLGHYRQLRDQDRLLVRCEFMLQLADETHSLLQINDGSNLWLRQQRGPLQTQGFINLRKVREAQLSAAAQTPGSTAAVPLVLALGGLTQWLTQLADHFEFTQPRESELKGVPTWEIAGRWNREMWDMILPGQSRKGEDQAFAGEKLPEHLPDRVHVVLGRDQNFPLFPYRIEYQRSRRLSKVVGVASGQEIVVEPLVTLELFEVHRPASMNPAEFIFQPSNAEDELDLTEKYLNKLGWGAPREEAK